MKVQSQSAAKGETEILGAAEVRACPPPSFRAFFVCSPLLVFGTSPTSVQLPARGPHADKLGSIESKRRHDRGQAS